MSAQVWLSPTDTTHASWTMGPRTLCGVELKPGWRQEIEVRHADDSTVECRKCRKVLQQSSAGEIK